MFSVDAACCAGSSSNLGSTLGVYYQDKIILNASNVVGMHLKSSWSVKIDWNSPGVMQASLTLSINETPYAKVIMPLKRN